MSTRSHLVEKPLPGASMEAKTVIKITINSYNSNGPELAARGVTGLAPYLNQITIKKGQ